MREITVDIFAGGGGASVGIEQAIGGPVTAAINHDPVAIAIHRANHPETEHWIQNVVSAHPLDVTQGRPVGLAWFSPDCTHHSKARGGKPKKKNIRDLAWVVPHWIDHVRPRVIVVENVEEFAHWGPLLPNGQPCPVSRGFTFQAWARRIRRSGYRLEYRELVACEYGTPTTRKRLFVIARCDGLPIVWPSPTHGRPDSGLLPFRSAAECIDWSIPCPSIFTREQRGKKPLVPKSCRRIAKGVQRYVLDNPRPFLIALTHHGSERVYDSQDPLRTITCAHRGEFALITPTLMVNTTGSAGGSVEDPLKTITTGDHHYAVAPYIVPRYGERPTQEPRTRSVERPLQTIVPTNNGGQLVAAFMAQHNTGSVGHSLTNPLSTIMASGCQQQLVAANLIKLRNHSVGSELVDPLHTIAAAGTHHGLVAAFLSVTRNRAVGRDLSGPCNTLTGNNHMALVAAFLDKYNGTGVGHSLDEPLATVTSRDRFSLVTVIAFGIEWVIIDLGMRMLQPRELFSCQGFPISYIIDPRVNGKVITKTAQVKAVGNSVPPQLASAIVEANYQPREVGLDRPADGPLFTGVSI